MPATEAQKKKYAEHNQQEMVLDSAENVKAAPPEADKGCICKDCKAVRADKTTA